MKILLLHKIEKMLKLKVAAFSISNLTDARYFSAYGVDWLAYNLQDNKGSLANLDRVQEIINWVEGPKSIGMFNAAPAANILQAIQDRFSLDALYIADGNSENINLPVFSKNKVSEGSYQVLDSTDQLKEVEEKHMSSVFVKISKLTEVESVLTMKNPPGIILEGGEEAQVGLKSFEMYDDIFDLLYN
jgi:hypothetical protein